MPDNFMATRNVFARDRRYRPDSGILAPEDRILRDTYLAFEGGAFHSPISYSASLDVDGCSIVERQEYDSLLVYLQRRGLLKITQSDELGVSWHLTLDGVEYIEKAGIVDADTASYHRAARAALINRFLGERTTAKGAPVPSQINYETFSPEVLAANALLIFTRPQYG